MTAPTALRLGAPGVHPVTAPPRFPALTPVRLDVAGFVGVALRGPVDEPVEVTRWSDFVARFGGFEPTAEGAQRLLPYAVQAFFAQGGATAHVLRVTAHPDDDGLGAGAATALLRLALGAGVDLTAADEGAWGSSLTIRMEFDVGRPVRVQARDGGRELVLPAGTDPPAWSLVRLRGTGTSPLDELRWLAEVVTRPTAAVDRTAVLDTALPAGAVDLELELVTGTLVVEETGAAPRRAERLHVGLHPGHARFAHGVLRSESRLARPVDAWGAPLRPAGTALHPVVATMVHGGLDRTSQITYDSFFDDGAADADPLDEQPHRGVDALGRRPEIGLLCVPDLDWRATGPAPTPPPAPVPVVCCDTCAGEQPAPDPPARPDPPRRLDPGDPVERAEIVRRQRRLVDVADLRRRFVALLDVPRGLAPREVTGWRSAFASSFAAAYHPWLGVPGVGDPRRQVVAVPPSAFAAGIIAARERRFGLPWGPANELAVGAVVATDPVTDALHDELHLLGINVYRAERDGFRLTAARTLSTDPEYRQLSVRRLMTMLALAIDRQLQWLVFEPNTPALRDRLRGTLTDFLRALHRRGAFAGDTETSAFFVRCDDGLNPSASQALGRLLAEVGVAPAAPLEYLLLRVTQDVDGALQVVDERG